MRSIFLTLAITLFLVNLLRAQTMTIANLNDSGNIETSEIRLTEPPIYHRSSIQQIPNFPVGKPAHPNFKNFRNVSIADLNNDGHQEVVVCLNETLFTFQYDGSILWQYGLDGTANFPPAIADIDLDGDLEVAVQTYGVPSKGNVYLFDHAGQLQEGWPLNIDNHFFFNGVVLANLDQEGPLEIIASERVNTNLGRIHALKLDASSISADWPISIPGTPAFTPSVGDINNDEINELITCTTTAIYAFDQHGSLLNGFPVEEVGAKFSYQSPLLVDLNEDSNLEILTARHNELPGTTAFDYTGNYYGAWPIYDNIWTFATPAVGDVDQDGDFEIFFSRPHFSEEEEDAIVLGYDHEGNELDGFPINGKVGAEGVISIADIDNDGDFEIITASIGVSEDRGFIHAYHFEDQSEVVNFPLRVEGFSYLNGAFLSDIDNDGKLDLTALSYQLKFDASSPDSAFINVFNLEVPFKEENILFNGYKGSLEHTGLVQKTISNTMDFKQTGILTFFPNPVTNEIEFQNADRLLNKNLTIYDQKGRLVSKTQLVYDRLNVSHLKSGTYYLFVEGSLQKFIKI